MCNRTIKLVYFPFRVNVLPLRIRKIIICNVGSSILAKTVNVIISPLSSKIQSRIQFIGKSDPYPDIEIDSLPKELGGTQRTMAETIELSIKTWIDRDKVAAMLRKFGNFEIDESVPTEGFEEMQGSFRRLEVD